MKIESGSGSGDLPRPQSLRSPTEHQGIDFGDRGQRSAPRQSAFGMGTNSTVDLIADHLRHTPPDWDSIFAQIKEMPKAPDTHPDMVGLVGEIHVNQAVKALASSPDFEGDIDLDPIPSGTEAGDYFFYRDKKNNMSVRTVSNGLGVTEYDLFIEAEGLPVIGEVRITDNRHGMYRKGHGFTRMIEPETVEKKLAPIEALYESGDAAGYIAIATNDVILEDYQTGEYTGTRQPPYDTPEKRFLEQGGIIVTLPFTLGNISAEVFEYRKTGKGVRKNKSELKGKGLQSGLLDKFPDLASKWTLKDR